MTIADKEYILLLSEISEQGELVETRNGQTKRLFDLPRVVFNSFPLITIRKPAIKKAIEEFMWFLSGEDTCPPNLMSWWAGQLNPENKYLLGYGHQLRKFNGWFDQVEELIDGLVNHPYSRRHVITTWNPADMWNIVDENSNPLTPTTCHTTLGQFFCSRDNTISAFFHQRSADMLLGLPHNWIQSWAFLLWLARQSGRQINKMIWSFGDAHIYMEESHQNTLQELLSCLAYSCTSIPIHNVDLMYWAQAGKPFNVEDFSIIGDIPEPKVLSRPRLL